MADDKKSGSPKNVPQEARILSELASGSGKPSGVISYTGLVQRSPRDGYWLIYPTLDMRLSVEISQQDILHTEELPPERSPFGSLGGTRIFVRKGATVTTTRSASSAHSAGSRNPDDFDLDIRLGSSTASVAPRDICFGTEDGTTCAAECGGGTDDTCFTCVSCGDSCRITCNETCGRTCNTCKTDCGQTCDTCKTCQTNCGQQTCYNTCQTCQTNCNQATCQTCQTCQTKCNQVTCHTCDTQCKQATCVTCETCRACTHVTCFRTCDIC